MRVSPRARQGLVLAVIGLAAAVPSVALGSDDDLGSDDEFGSPGIVTLLGIDESTFNPSDTPVGFQLSHATYAADPESVRVWLDGELLDERSIAIEPALITVPISSPDGRHRLELLASDHDGRLISAEFDYWSGSYSTVVTVLDPQGRPAEGVSVTTELNQDKRITKQSVTDADGATPPIENLPECCIAHIARGPNNEFDSAVASPARTEGVTLALRGFNEPSEIDNNDFSQGLAGWETGDAPVRLVPHQEDPGNPDETSSSDWDLAIGTSRTASPQTVSRSFRVAPGTKEVILRYRVESSCGPDAGSSETDPAGGWYSVSLRSERSGRVVYEVNSIEGGADFDAAGSTPWRDTRLPLEPGDDLVEVFISPEMSRSR